MPATKRSSIYVVAGVNGGGKSSIQGAMLLEAGSEYYNPDEAAREVMAFHPALTQRQANTVAWNQGVGFLKKAINRRLNYAFESTLGAHTIPALLKQAAKHGIEIHIWYVGLSSPELHIARVRQRVAQGGHDIPEEDIRRRYRQSRLNLIDLLPSLTSLHVFDNSYEADPGEGKAPKPELVLHMKNGKIIAPTDLAPTPTWAKQIVAAAIISDGR